MPRKPKNESDIVATPAADPLSTSAELPAKAARKSATAAKKASSKTAAKKKTATAPAKKRSSSTGKKNQPSDADIRLRAYFIAERRVQNALQGDPAEDWIEARKQLLEENR